MTEATMPEVVATIDLETAEGITRPAPLPCRDCGSREWLYYADGSRRVQCRGCKRFIGYDLTGRRAGRQPAEENHHAK